MALTPFALGLASPQIAHAQISDPSGILDCSVSSDVSFNLQPSSAPIRGFGPNSWTYKNVTTIAGISYDLKVTQIAAAAAGGYTVNNSLAVGPTNWNPRRDPYIILNYEMQYSATGQPATVDRFTFVQGDIDGQFFGGNNSSKMLEIIGFQSAEATSIIPVSGLGNGTRRFLNRTTPSGYATYRQGSPSNVTNNSHDIAVTYENKSSFNVLYGMTARSNWTNNTTRNFFFRSFTGSTLAGSFRICPADYSDTPSSFGDVAHKYADGLRLGAVNTVEDSAVPNADTGDDGISTFPDLKTNNTSYTLPAGNISATDSGTLHGWIDFDQSGTFDASEYASTSVNAGVVSGDLEWPSLPALAEGSTYACHRQ